MTQVATPMRSGGAPIEQNSANWTAEAEGAWSGTARGRPGRPKLALAVVTGEAGEWARDVREMDDDVGVEVASGIASSADEARAAADAAAASYARS